MNAPKTILTLLVSALAITACGGGSSEKKPATQVAAKVNGGEVSVHQINFILQRTPSIPADQVDGARRQVLEGLIDQELAVQQAVEMKLDRTPNVMQMLEASRREVLARAYLEQAGGGGVKPSATEIRAYYNDHPELFAKRKVYRLEEINFAGTPELVGRVKEQLARGKSSAEVLAALRTDGVAVSGGVAVKAAEQISLDALPRLAAAKEGQPQLFEDAGKAAIVTVLATKPDPMDEGKAPSYIESYLINKQKADRATEAMKQLRAKAKIEYAGDFAGSKPAAPVAEKAAPTASEAVINKGVAGLK
ncbi:EpsD family peptidyl-prolyl cis-trans isomerase [Accumulibacter sp.]|uniref:EpsD family peptidyl-prolyl cis-trans isomerase n=1 Tax=Accumulibacter sp. TaxID=2053492 RepID=UPI0025DABAFC|nr:EpsD family peptidyl-prolyl cis-trans isomerase [Accumulibacter sp.]MCM8611615.1 EpsD family peptidyl-prolyl cis-trans isomerase [Accumulibacter sp.]MCM8635380.1 EpsD family peptidyl-prolyl cis-trans isomerase [Accumulibacter sp.]MCM8638985.1 EpsD family peptidyl-prolyl cis-trans isomerase [Accumulibacter sp.]